MYGHSGGMFSDGMIFGGGVLMWVFWFVVLVVLIYVVKLIFGSVNRNATDKEEPLDILKKRYARGEIDDEEFERRKKQL